MSARAAIVSTKYPYPNDDGKKTVLAGFLAYLLDRFGRDDVTYFVVGKEQAMPGGQALCRTVWIEPPRAPAQAWNLFKSFCRIERRSLQEAVTASARVQRTLHRLVGALAPEILILDTLRMGQYFWDPVPGMRRILYMDDLFSLRFRRMTDVKAAEGGLRYDPSGTFAPMLPGFARKLIRLGPLQTFLYRTEAQRMERREAESTGRFDRCLLINPNEARLLSEQCPGQPVSPVKPLLFPHPCPAARSFDGAPSFLLFGSLRHPVYRASVIRFLERAMDPILEAMPDAKIVLVGEGAGEEIQRLCRRFPNNVEMLGFVENLDGIFSSACALLVPLLAAGGLKLKILTALYYGLPIVATEVSVDGIPMQDGVHYLREDAVERFAVHMTRLRDRSYNEVMSRNVSDLFREHYSREAVFREYDQLLRT